MNVIIVGYQESVNKAVEMLSEKYIESEEDIIEVCNWSNCQEVSNMLENKEQYDYYVVAACDITDSNEICKLLNYVYGISNDRIINYFLLSDITKPFMKVDRMMLLPEQNYKGMILGLSYSAVGILPELLEEPFINLSVSSQDLFYNLKTLEYCMEKYPEKIKNLKYLVLDLFDYTYFNYDVSKSKTIVTYVSTRGFINNEHNFALNKNYDTEYRDIVSSILRHFYKDVTEEKLLLWDSLFGDIHMKDGYKGFSVSEDLCYRTKIVTDEDVEKYVVDTSIVKNRYEDTIKENISIFYQILETAKKINPDIRIMCILLPTYSKAQEKAADYYKDWKTEFYNIISNAKQKYDFEFYDLKDNPISQKAECYMDISHFNYAGAMEFTKLLSKLF